MKKPGWLDEFKTFISRGNVIDLAVGVVVGGAFTAIVTALVNDIINPLISLIIGGLDFSGVTVGVFPIGDLIMAIINFLCISFVVFWMVKIIKSFNLCNIYSIRIRIPGHMHLTLMSRHVKSIIVRIAIRF